MSKKEEKQIQGFMTSTFLVQVASVPGHQAGQRRFEQSRYLHELLVNTLTTKDEDQQQQIKALTTLVPQHEIVLRSGFSQTAQWGLEPNMFLQIHGDENQARLISALFGQAFCQDGIGIGGGAVEGESHGVLIIQRDWQNEDERLNLVSNILRQYPSLSAQLDVNGQLALHDYSMSSFSLAEIKSDIERYLQPAMGKYFIEERQMKSELIDRTEYENLLMLLETNSARRVWNILRGAHARLFSGYACGSLTLPSFPSRRRRQKRREQSANQLERYIISPSHLCSIVFSASRPCMCLTDNNCFCHYTLILATRLSPSQGKTGGIVLSDTIE